MLSDHNAIVLEEQIHWNDRSLQGCEIKSGCIVPQSTQFIRVDRNLKDDTFNITAPERSKDDPLIFTVNNIQPEGVVSMKQDDGFNIDTAHRSLFKNVHLADTSEIAVRQDALGDFSYSISLFPEIVNMNKNVTLGEDNYLKLVSINSVTFNVVKQPQDQLSPVFKDGSIKPVIDYNITYVVPKKFNETTGNKSLFDIYTSNESNASIFADYSTDEGKLTATSLSKSGMKTYFNPITSTEGTDPDRIPENTTKVGEIQLYDNQFYNYNTKKMENGYGSNSEQGLIVPYNFSGEFKENVIFSPNAAFQNLNINMFHKIKQPLLNKYDGKIILSIADTDTPAGPYNIISSDKIRMLADNDPTLSGLERISVEENI